MDLKCRVQWVISRGKEMEMMMDIVDLNILFKGHIELGNIEYITNIHI
jgi:hypothetical protein